MTRQPLSDGAATAGKCLHTIVSMISREEVPVQSFCGMQDEHPIDDEGRQISVGEVNGDTLLLPHQDPARWVGRPVQMSDLRGQVVLLDVWTFG